MMVSGVGLGRSTFQRPSNILEDTACLYPGWGKTRLFDLRLQAHGIYSMIFPVPYVENLFSFKRK